MNADSQYELMKLVIAWTLIGAFIITVILVLASMVGWVKFADQKQQNKLFYVILVELASGCVGFFLNIVNPNPATAKKKIEAPLQEEKQQLQGEKSTLAKELSESKTQVASVMQSLDAAMKEKEDVAGRYQVAMQQTEQLKEQLSKMASAPNKNEEAEQKIAALSAQVQSLQQDKAELTQAAQASQGRLQETQRALEAMKAMKLKR